MVPSNRSVPRCLPVRSAGPETSSTSSRIWNASADVRAEGTERGRPCPRCDHPRTARPGGRRRRKGRRLQLAALDVAVGGHVGDQASSRCISSPRASAERGVRKRAHGLGLSVATNSAKAREKRKSPVAVAALRPAALNTVVCPRRRRRAVEHVVVHQRGHVHELDGHRGGTRRSARRLARRTGTPAAGAAACRRRASVLAAWRPSAGAVARRRSRSRRCSARASRRVSCGPPDGKRDSSWAGRR